LLPCVSQCQHSEVEMSHEYKQDSIFQSETALPLLYFVLTQLSCDAELKSLGTSSPSSWLMLHATCDLDTCRPVGKDTLKHCCRAEFGGMEPF
jgi:hypothetical protein